MPKPSGLKAFSAPKSPAQKFEKKSANTQAAQTGQAAHKKICESVLNRPTVLTTLELMYILLLYLLHYLKLLLTFMMVRQYSGSAILKDSRAQKQEF